LPGRLRDHQADRRAPAPRLATTARIVERLRKALAEAIGNPLANTVVDRALVFETCCGAEAVANAALKVGTRIAAGPGPVQADQTGEAEFTAFAKNADVKRHCTNPAVAS
jgi:hypothetical protein